MIADQPRSSEDLLGNAFGGLVALLPLGLTFTELLRKETPLSVHHPKRLRTVLPEPASDATIGNVHTCKLQGRAFAQTNMSPSLFASDKMAEIHSGCPSADHNRC